MTKLLTRILFPIALALSIGARADQYYRVKIAFTGNPSDGNTVVINGVTKTFKTVVATAATQVLIGATATDTAVNLNAHNQSYPYSRITSTQSGTQVDLIGEISFVIAASMTGTWGTAVAAAQTITQFSLVLPLSGESATTRGTRANALVDAFQYASSAFTATWTALANLVNTSTAQTVDGAKTFRGANVYSNTSQTISGGSATNIILKTMRLRFDNTNANGLEFLASGDTRVTTIAPDIYGIPTIYDTGSTETPTNAFGPYAPNAGNLLSRGMGDYRYGQLGAANAWTAANTFSALTTVSDLEGSITNATGGFYNLFGTNITAQSKLIVSNAAPDIIFNDTDATADNKRVHLIGSNGDLQVMIESDDLGTVSIPFSILRTGNDVDKVYMGGPIGLTEVEGTFWANGDSLLAGNAGVSAILTVGTTNLTAPAGMSQGILVTNATTEPSADPAHQGVIYAFNDELKYREPGSGVNLRLKNAGADVFGAGSDYPITGSYAQVVYGSGGNTISLPTAGTYVVEVVAAIDESSTANDVIYMKLYNSTAAADVSNSERHISSLPASTRGQIRLRNTITVTTTSTLQLWAKNTTAARGSVASTETSMSYVRLY